MSAPEAPDPDSVDRILRAALAEDLGTAGDRTTEALVPAELPAWGRVRAEEPMVVAGAALCGRVFRLLDARVEIVRSAGDGARQLPGDLLLEVRGAARALLTGERTALNLLGRLCGVASAAREAVDAVAGTAAQIYDTRKTTPGLRLLEKYAVRCGGAQNHRLGLHDMALIKDNHVALAGGVGPAVRRARQDLPPGIPLQVEVTTLGGLTEAIEAGADLVLLDNMDVETMRQAVQLAAGRARLEASGGITPATAARIAREAGVERISMGWITRSARCLDVSMDIEADAP